MSKSRKSKSVAEQFAALDDERPEDYDPEELNGYDAPSDDSASESDSESDSDSHARDHYVDVEKSKLRKREGVSLGPQYKGARVSRGDAFEAEEDEPFQRDFGEKEEEEDRGDQVEGMNKRVNGNYGSDTSGSEDAASDDGADAESGPEEELSEDISDEAGSERFGESGEDEEIDRAELRRIMAQDQKDVAATISQAAKADVAKGQAVKKQRNTFDALLNVRIRLQKSLVSTNSLAASDAAEFDNIEGSEAMKAAENAAFTLWNSLNNLREKMEQSRTGSKRKHAEFTVDSSSSELWSLMKSYDSSALPNRQAALNKWSVKARGATTALNSTRGRLSNVKEQTLTDVLNAQLLDKERLIKRTRTPRSCAPLQAASGVTESAGIYDDADFYGLMLKELLEQRSADTSSAAALGAGFNVSAPWQAARDARTKKAVDTKASKGRKLRYAVHEKLQNFMAPEDRGTWGSRQVDDLFSSLFGRKVELMEREVSDPEEDGTDEMGGKEGLKLFR